MARIDLTGQKFGRWQVISLSRGPGTVVAGGSVSAHAGLRAGPERLSQARQVRKLRLLFRRAVGPGHRRHQPISACTSMRVGVSGATPIAIANAIMPSIRPDERFFDNLRFDASGPSTTALAAHIVSTG
jgi:hypothetical protein